MSDCNIYNSTNCAYNRVTGGTAHWNTVNLKEYSYNVSTGKLQLASDEEDKFCQLFNGEKQCLPDEVMRINAQKASIQQMFEEQRNAGGFAVDEAGNVKIKVKEYYMNGENVFAGGYNQCSYDVYGVPKWMLDMEQVDDTVSTERYEIGQSVNKSNGKCIGVVDKETSQMYEFARDTLRFQKDSVTGKTLLIDTAKKGDIMVADDELLQAMQDYFGVDHIDISALQGYTIHNDNSEGILTVSNNAYPYDERKVLFENAETGDKLIELKNKYANLIGDDKFVGCERMATNYAYWELHGIGYDTGEGMVLVDEINGQVTYLTYQENNPAAQKNAESSSWTLQLTEDAPKTARTDLMNFIQKLLAEAKDLSDLSNWNLDYMEIEKELVDGLDEEAE